MSIEREKRPNLSLAGGTPPSGFREVSVEMINEGRVPVVLTSMKMEIIRGRPTRVELRPGEKVHLPDHYYRIETADGSRPNMRLNYGKAKGRRHQ